MGVLAPGDPNTSSAKSKLASVACSPSRPTLIVTPATPENSPPEPHNEQQHSRLFPTIPPKPRRSPRITVPSIHPIVVPCTPVCARPLTPPPTPPTSIPTSLPIPIESPHPHQHKQKRPPNPSRFSPRRARNAATLRDKRKCFMDQTGKLRLKVSTPVYVPFQTPKPVLPSKGKKRYLDLEWGGLRFTPYGFRTEDIVAVQGEEEQTGANMDGDLLEAGTRVEGEGGATDITDTRTDTTTTRTASPPAEENIVTRLTHAILHHVFTPLIRIFAFITAPIRRRYEDWDAHRGPLGSHSTRTGRWLRRTRSWTSAQEYGYNYGNEYGNGYSNGYCNDYGIGYAEDNGLGSVNGQGRGVRSGYGTFPVWEPTSRESMRAKGLGTVVSWEEGAPSVSW